MSKIDGRRVIWVAGIFTLLIWVIALVPAKRELTVTVMDVGEGLCVVVNTPDNKTMIMDCGTSGRAPNSEVGVNTVLPYLTKNGETHLDLALLSHPHSDHMCGFPSLFRSLRPDIVISSGSGEDNPQYRSFTRAVTTSHSTYRIARDGQTIRLGNDVIIQLLVPNADSQNSTVNERCIIVRLVYKSTAFILTGDADSEEELSILSQHKSLRAQVLQVGHHGSATSTSTSWLAAIRPQIAVVSCGRNNIYGHPSPSTVSRIHSIGARFYRTDRDGAVVFRSDGSTIVVSPTRRP